MTKNKRKEMIIELYENIKNDLEEFKGNDYKVFLDKLENKKQIKSHVSNNTDVSVNIVIEFDEDKLTNMLADGSIYKKLGLAVKKHTTNMHLFSPENQIHKYKTPFEIIEEFFDVRMDFYVKRKSYFSFFKKAIKNHC